jgi:hypothetical protein
MTLEHLLAIIGGAALASYIVIGSIYFTRALYYTE